MSLSKPKHMLSLLAALMAGSALAAPAHAADLGALDEPIVLALNEWTGQHITTKIAGRLLEKMGYEVEFVTAGYYPQFEALRDGSISATLEVWSNNIGEHFEANAAAGHVEDIGEVGLSPKEGWVYPAYLEETCPGLPSWEALDTCADQLVTSDTFPKGRIVDYPADWGDMAGRTVRALEMNFATVNAGSEGALIAEIKGAVAAQKPVVVMFWAPHWVFAEIDLKWVDLPAYNPACPEDASWGLNPNEVWDCGLDPARVFKVTWTGFDEKWPAGHRLLRELQVTNEIQIPLMKAVDVDGQDVDVAVDAWIAENEAVWQPWIDAATN